LTENSDKEGKERRILWRNRKEEERRKSYLYRKSDRILMLRRIDRRGETDVDAEETQEENPSISSGKNKETQIDWEEEMSLKGWRENF
jgi:hypothetical protein